jgi:hypothetical protein
MIRRAEMSISKPYRALALVGVFGALGAGCAARGAPPQKVTTTAAPHAHNPGDHNHARGKMLLASDGTYNALLTAHLSAKDGNELDIFVEDKDGPFALNAKTLEATARSATDETKTLSFTCAPANERPTAEVEGTCSHYVAKAPWITVGQPLRVETSLPMATRPVPMVWREFEPRKYAHHEE